MSWIVTLLVVVQVICAGAIIILVLLQHGKGADMGAAFGSGASGSLFGASGSANFLSRSTAVIATVFFLATIGLAYSANNLRSASAGIMSRTPAAPALPAAPDASQGVPQQIPSQSAPQTTPQPAGGTANPAPAAPADKSAGIPK